MAPCRSIASFTSLMYAASARMHLAENCPDGAKSPISSTQDADVRGRHGHARIEAQRDDLIAALDQLERRGAAALFREPQGRTVVERHDSLAHDPLAGRALPQVGQYDVLVAEGRRSDGAS